MASCGFYTSKYSVQQVAFELNLEYSFTTHDERLLSYAVAQLI